MLNKFKNRSWLRKRVIIKNNKLYMWRLQILRSPKFILYLHLINKSDTIDTLHTHPGHSKSLCIWGKASETLFLGDVSSPLDEIKSKTLIRNIPKFVPVSRQANYPHRIDIIKKPYISIFWSCNWVNSWSMINLITGDITVKDEGFIRTVEHYNQTHHI